MKILFCGQLISPFILNDYELLQTKFDVDLINMDVVPFTRKNIFNYIYYILTLGVEKVSKSDIIFIWVADYPALPLILLSKLFNKKCVLIIGGWEVANYPEIGYGNQLNIVRGAITRWCIRNSDMNIIPSNIYKYITLAIEPNINIKVVANTIKSEPYDLSIDKQDNVITALFILNHNTSLLKGIETFKNAADRLPYSCKVYDAVSHEDLMNILRESKVYCQLSYTESFGVTNLEAMACGCIPVVTDRGALPEVIGNCGIIVPYGDVDATIDAINVAIKMDGNIARDRAKMFINDQRLNEISNIFDELIEPLVSVVIPSYNSSQWLIETIASITVQSYKNIEIIVVDDYSTDDTKELIESMLDDRIQYIQNNHNRGECISSRVGFAHAKGDYICRLSSDDMWINIHKLKHQVQIMKDTGADWSYNAINCIGNSLFDNKVVKSYWMSVPTRYGYKFAPLLQLFDNFILGFPRIAFLMMLLRGNPVNSSTLMFKRSSYMNNEQWSNTHRTDCDGLLLFKSLLKGLRGVAIFEMGALYRTHAGQMSFNPDYITEMKVIRKEIVDEIINQDYPIWLRFIMKSIKRYKYH